MGSRSVSTRSGHWSCSRPRQHHRQPRNRSDCQRQQAPHCQSRPDVAPTGRPHLRHSQPQDGQTQKSHKAHRQRSPSHRPRHHAHRPLLGSDCVTRGVRQTSRSQQGWIPRPPYRCAHRPSQGQWKSSHGALHQHRCPRSTPVVAGRSVLGGSFGSAACQSGGSSWRCASQTAD